jgi:glycosyltransferase involved in cell wall biosynthesis
MAQVKKVLLIENSAADFYKARIPLYKHLKAEGWDVYALVPEEEYIDEIRAEGVNVVAYSLTRSNKGIAQLIKLVKMYSSIIKKHDFDIIHSFRFQPNLINILANFFNRRKLILHITGFGIAFSNTSFHYRILRLVSQIVFQVKLLRADTVVVQNYEDAKEVWFPVYWKDKIRVIEGSGVDIDHFSMMEYNKQSLRLSLGVAENDIVFICVTRLIWEKGIEEMIEAIQHFNQAQEGKRMKLWIVGWSDTDNPRHVNDAYIKQFESSPDIHFLGRKKDVRSLLAASDVFLYPSYYREGIPRGILEALSMELPIITTDMPGCNLTVIEGENGYILVPRSSQEIVNVLEQLPNQAKLTLMGKKSRQLVETKFSNSVIFSQIAALYLQ